MKLFFRRNSFIFLREIKTLKPNAMKKLFYLAFISCLFTACMNDMSMDHTAAIKEKTQRFYDEVINAHNVAAIDSFCTSDFVDHNPEHGHSGKGIDDLKTSFKDFFAA